MRPPRLIGSSIIIGSSGKGDHQSSRQFAVRCQGSQTGKWRSFQAAPCCQFQLRLVDSEGRKDRLDLNTVSLHLFPSSLHSSPCIYSPSNEWQDNVTAMLNVAAGFEADKSEEDQDAQGNEGGVEDAELRSPLRIVPPQRPASSDTHTSDENQSPARRQRRRIGEHDFSPHGLHYPTSPNASSASLAHTGSAIRRRGRSFSQTYSSLSPLHPLNQQRRCSSFDSLSSDSEDDLTGAVGQLSLNEDEQVRYHGKASGLHILHNKERVDNRNEGGIW